MTTHRSTQPARVRRFEVWLDKNVIGTEPSVEIVEMPEDASDAECNEACSDALETMISNELDTGWRELNDDE